MTKATSQVWRETEGDYVVLYRKARPIMVGIERVDLLTFREKGRRGKWTLPVSTAFKYAVRLAAFEQAADRRHNRKGRHEK